MVEVDTQTLSSDSVQFAGGQTQPRDDAQMLGDAVKTGTSQLLQQRKHEWDGMLLSNEDSMEVSSQQGQRRGGGEHWPSRAEGKEWNSGLYKSQGS